MRTNAVRFIRAAFSHVGGSLGRTGSGSGTTANPDTPNERINPQQTGLEHIKAASISLERSKEFITDPLFAKVIDAMIGALNKGLLQFDGASVMAALQASIGGGMSPAMAPPVAPGMGAPPQGGLGGQTPPAAPPMPGPPPGVA